MTFQVTLQCCKNAVHWWRAKTICLPSLAVNKPTPTKVNQKEEKTLQTFDAKMGNVTAAMQADNPRESLTCMQ